MRTCEGFERVVWVQGQLGPDERASQRWEARRTLAPREAKKVAYLDEWSAVSAADQLDRSSSPAPLWMGVISRQTRYARLAQATAGARDDDDAVVELHGFVRAGHLLCERTGESDGAEQKMGLQSGGEVRPAPGSGPAPKLPGPVKRTAGCRAKHLSRGSIGRAHRVGM